MRRQLLVFPLASWGLVATSFAARFAHPADEPAMMSALAARSPLLAVERAGTRMVAVGRRGHVVYSDDDGATWRQAAVPVSVDLLGVSFPTAQAGWAVGHAGVVLATRDGGATWTRQLGGKQAAELAVLYYRGRSAPTPEETRALKQAEAQWTEAGAQPFLDVWFESETAGFVVGAFNTILRTEDGGKTWVPWMDRTSNPHELHFYAVRGRKGRIFLAGEQGQVWRLDTAAKKFLPAATPYKGTLFGLVVRDGGAVIAFGMRGAVYRSPDDGTTWQKVAMQTGAGVTAGTTLPDGRIVLVDQGGGVHTSGDGGRTFAMTRLARPVPYSGVAPGNNGTVVLTGAAGVASLARR